MSSPRRASLVLAAVLLLAAWGFAAAADEAPADASSSRDFLGKVVNFVILFGALGYILRKPLAQFLAGRVEKTRASLKNAEDAALEAEARLSSIEARTGTLESEIEAMRQRAEADGLAQKERIMRAARDEAARLRQFAEQEIEAQVRAGVRQLKEYATDKAMALALDRLKTKLTPEAQARLLDASIAKLAEAHEEQHPGPTLRPRTH